MAQTTAQKSELSSTLTELVGILPALFKKMKEKGVEMLLMNQPHDKPYEGEPIWYHISAFDPGRVQMENGHLKIEHEDVIYRMHQSKNKSLLDTLKLFLKWATESFEQLMKGVIPQRKILTVPPSITFFSASTLPPRKPVLLWR